ncbi:FAD FMN-containing isoamyl alcohol oxidase [Fusarium albosuccineum]|uniref:FAD FMN-containing isoamyl alcohol oxidase n=1 Tax=Fusarium albosuccineum TaxID=1237068 RepID=A0A8H4PEQ8_9HYPO|nr:FAD FMN-containing isoamyl alcohol oxidase [Fusarium albosuccineum]
MPRATTLPSQTIASGPGHLHAIKPVGAVCHGSTYDAEACSAARKNQYSSVWRSANPAAVEWPNWEAWPEQGQSCYIDTEKSTPCGQGRVSLYSLQAQSPEDIQAGVRFAHKHNLRVAIRNTGHDFAGRSVAPESLQINTHLMTDKKVHKKFKPAGCNGTDEGLAVTVGAGVQLYDMYKWLGEHDVMVVGGSSHGVGITGGYIQGGGHSMLSAIGGMGSDNALEFTVVTADGRHVVANSYQNTDLFWALRGGGGGTWGVVTSVTVRAFKDPPMVTFSLTGGAPFGNESYWEAVERFHAFLPEFNDAGGNMYYWLMPDLKDPGLGHVSVITASGGFGNQSSKAAIDKLIKPLVKELSEITGTPFNYTSILSPKSAITYAETNKAPDKAGQRVILGSRIVTRDFLKSSEGPGKVTAALRSMRTYHGESVEGQNAIQGLVVAGPAVRANADKVDSALHPIWRKALLHIVLARGWDADATVAVQQEVQRNLTEVEVPILKSLEPGEGGGAYLNEADGYEENFQDSFWGSNYPRLYELKQKLDPENLFIVRRGVGSEDWDAEGLCRK